jgi:hypothetical protein
MLLEVRQVNNPSSISSNCLTVAKLLEQPVSLVSTVELPKGLKIHPAQGTIRCGKLEINSTISEKFFLFESSGAEEIASLRNFFTAVSTFEHSTDCTCCDFGHLQFI